MWSLPILSSMLLDYAPVAAWLYSVQGVLDNRVVETCLKVSGEVRIYLI